MTSTPKVSVIIPTYNRANFVAKAIDSVLAQFFRDYEVIVIDDGSTDNTGKVLQAYRSEIQYIYQENSGASAARNAGVRLAKGEWIAFLDSDDEWLPDYLSWQMRRAETNPHVCTHVVNAVEVSINGETNLRYKLPDKFKTKPCLVVKRPLHFILKNYITTLPVIIMRRDAMLRAGLFDPALTMAEDIDLIARMGLQGPLGICDKALANFYRRDEPVANLTRQMTDKGFYFHEATFKVYENLRRQKNLNFREKFALTKIMSSNRRSLANLLLQYGRMMEARKYYKDAFSIYPSIKSLVRYIFSFLPANLALRFVRERGAVDGRRMELERNLL